MPDETATSDIARKFRPGARVVNRRDPRDAWRVEGYSSLGAGMLRLRCGAMNMLCPEEEWVAAPHDWVDPPVYPYGCAATGTSDEARRDKAAHDAADPSYQLARLVYKEDLFHWRKLHRNPLLARLANEQSQPIGEGGIAG